MVLQLLWLAITQFNFIDKLLEKAFDTTLDLLSSLTNLFGLEAELGKLHDTILRINAVLHDTNNTHSPHLNTTKKWLTDLTNIVFDAEDLIDEFHTRLQLHNSNSRSSRKRKRPWSHLDFTLYLQRWRISSRVKDIREYFNSITDERLKLQLSSSEALRVRDGAVLGNASSVEGNHRVLGLDSVKEEVLGMLRDRGGGLGSNIVAVLGAGGAGKTTLARMVFNDGEVMSLFELRVWVCVSDDFDEVSVSRKIVESMDGGNCGDLSFDLLQRRLQGRFSGKKFLLVLDGLSSENPSFWETMSAPMMAGDEGSKILVTCRNELFLRFVGRMSRIVQLKGLGDEDSWSLFCQNAMGSDGWGQYTNLRDIGREIVRKCQGSPLAIRTIGCLLYGKRDEEEWKAIEDDLPDAENEGTNRMLLALKVSYDRLPLHLKKCYAFCSIFPTGYEFSKEELVKLWTAVGLVKQKGNRQPELIGSRYFDYLAWRSFFQTSSSPLGNNKKYRMPGLVNELAQSISENECLRIGIDSPTNGPQNARYALSNNCRLELLSQVIEQNASLRALLFLNQGGTFTKEVTDHIFQTLRCLRALDLKNIQLSNVPDSIGNLIHLRYLNLYNTGIQILPESMSNLYNLQVLELGGCEKLHKLPDSTCNLVNLRHLGLHLDWERQHNCWDNLVAMPPDIGTLTSLRTLSRFIVSSDNRSNLAQLKNLNLHGELCISKLENASDTDATEANLKSKKSLINLMLRWSTSSVSQNAVDEIVLTNLQPHNNLKSLWLENYNSLTFPSWLVSSSFNLETLTLSNCCKCEQLPLVGGLQKLKYLYLDGLSSVKHMGSAARFRMLQILKISNMCNLETWFEHDTGGMNCLKTLLISNCSKLREIPQVPESLESVEIRICPELTILPSVSSIKDVLIEGGSTEIMTSVRRITTLETLAISQLPELHSISREHLQGLDSLKQLKIENCAILASVSTKELASLEVLEISSCGNLSSFREGLPDSLKHFRLRLCHQVMSWPVGLQTLPALHSIEIQAVPSLSCLPAEGMPQSLQYLAISGCPLLEQHCLTNWHLLQNISKKAIGERSTF